MRSDSLLFKLFPYIFPEQPVDHLLLFTIFTSFMFGIEVASLIDHFTSPVMLLFHFLDSTFCFIHFDFKHLNVYQLLCFTRYIETTF